VKKSIFYSIICLLCAACSQVPEADKSIQVSSSAPEGRACAMCFAADSTIYIAGGRIQDGTYPATLLRYSIGTDQWTETAAVPLPPRVNGTVCCTEQDVYMGLGFGGGNVHMDSTYLHDWWRYSPTTDTWTALAAFPAPQTAAAVSWYDDECIWVACGFRGYTNDIWCYHIDSDRWTQATEQSPIRVMSAVAARCGGRYFIGSGFRNTSHSYWYEWFRDGHWEKCSSIPGKGRHNAACSATDKAVWVFGGWHYGDSLTTGFHYDDILRYTPDRDQWTLCGTIPCGTTENGVACAVGERVYFGLGEDKNGHIHTEWYYIED
jgi:N-acetylneuraminic acid mutarotase